LRLAIERLHRRQPGRDPGDDEHVPPAVARDPERRTPLLAATSRRCCERGEDEKQPELPHGSAFERTAPASVARTSPVCFPTQASAVPVTPCVGTVRCAPTWRIAPTAAAFVPLSS